MGAYLKILFLAVLMFTLSGFALEYQVRDLTGGKCAYSIEKVQLMVNNALSIELNNNAYLRGIIKIFPTQDGMQNYFVVNLLRSDMYLARTFRINLEQSIVTSVVEDYVEVEVEPQDSRVCSTCPNPNVEGLMSWITDFTTAVSNGQKCVQAMKDAGLVADQLAGSAESLTAIKNYLKCPKLKIWVRIGHGSNSSILLGGGQSISTSTTSSLASDIKNRIFIFNSCLSNNQLGPAFVTAGAYFFASGNISLVTGKEQVTTYFVNHAIKNKEQLDASMDAATKEANYPNAWGYRGAATKPWLYAKAGQNVTGIAAPSAGYTINRYNFYVTVTPQKVLFLNSGSSNVSIYNLTGKLVFSKTGLTEWDKTSVSGQEVNAGTYIAIATNGSKVVKQPFTILK